MGQAFLTPERDHIKTQTNEKTWIICEIYTPKRDDVHPRPFHIRSPPPGNCDP